VELIMDNADLTLRSLQVQLPWNLPYSHEFNSAQLPHLDFQHALMHVVKASGKLAALCDDADHGRDNFETEEVSARLADLVICALRMANTAPGGLICLQSAVEDRIESKNHVKLKRISPKGGATP
jgi:hypothetical protein